MSLPFSDYCCTSRADCAVLIFHGMRTQHADVQHTSLCVRCQKIAIHAGTLAITLWACCEPTRNEGEPLIHLRSRLVCNACLPLTPATSSPSIYRLERIHEILTPFVELAVRETACGGAAEHIFAEDNNEHDGGSVSIVKRTHRWECDSCGEREEQRLVAVPFFEMSSSSSLEEDVMEISTHVVCSDYCLELLNLENAQRGEHFSNAPLSDRGRSALLRVSRWIKSFARAVIERHFCWNPSCTSTHQTRWTICQGCLVASYCSRECHAQSVEAHTRLATLSGSSECQSNKHSAVIVGPLFPRVSLGRRAWCVPVSGSVPAIAARDYALYLLGDRGRGTDELSPPTRDYRHAVQQLMRALFEARCVSHKTPASTHEEIKSAAIQALLGLYQLSSKHAEKKKCSSRSQQLRKLRTTSRRTRQQQPQQQQAQRRKKKCT